MTLSVTPTSVLICKAIRMLGLENSLRRGSMAFLGATSILTWFVAFPVANAQDLFPDKNLEAAVRREVFEKRYNTEPITADDVKNISQVVGKGKGITSLEGLQHCKALMKLDLEKNEISDLNPIKELKQLQWIDLSSNKIESIEPLAPLTQTQYLQLSKNAISDVAPLREMSNLRSLYIGENKLKSLEPLSGLKKMWTLNVAGNPIEDSTPLNQMKGLDTVNLKGCACKSIEFVRSISPKFLMLSGNPIADFGPLAEVCESDAKGDRRIAPFLQLYIDENALKDPAQSKVLERLRNAGVRINPENK